MKRSGNYDELIKRGWGPPWPSAIFIKMFAGNVALNDAGLYVSLLVFYVDCALERWRLSSKLSLAAAYRQQQQLCSNPPYEASHSFLAEGCIPSVLRVSFPRGWGSQYPCYGATFSTRGWSYSPLDPLSSLAGAADIVSSNVNTQGLRTQERGVLGSGDLLRPSSHYVLGLSQTWTRHPETQKRNNSSSHLPGSPKKPGGVTSALPRFEDRLTLRDVSWLCFLMTSPFTTSRTIVSNWKRGLP